MIRSHVARPLAAATGLAVASLATSQPGTAFTYQGSLTSSGTPVSSAESASFRLFDTASGGTQIGSTISRSITPTEGIFTESLDFGVNAYVPNQALWLEIEIGGEILGRQKIEATPFSLNTRGIDVAANGDVTLTESSLYVDLPNFANTPDGSSILLSTPGGIPGIIIRRGDGEGGAASQWNMFIRENNNLQFGGPTVANADVQLTLGESGNVGVGTTTPDAKLDVQNGSLWVGGDSGGLLPAGAGSGIRIWNDSVTQNSKIIAYDYVSNQPRDLTLQTSGGFVGIGTDTPIQPLDVNGNVKIQGRLGIGTNTPATTLDVNGAVTIRGGADIVEGFDSACGTEVEPGTLMVIDPANPGKLMASGRAYDAKVAGVVSGANGVNPGIKLGQDGVMDGDILVAMTGRVYVKGSAENGAIEPGDRLTSSDLAGHAMKATDGERSDGAVIGKAMTGLDSGTGMVLVLVNLQ